MRKLFAQVIGARDPGPAREASESCVPADDERLAVENILATEFSRALDEGGEPTDRGRQVDETPLAILAAVAS